jgi:hypothetical protein
VTSAARVLLPTDEIVEVELASVEKIHGECLLIRRFDRMGSGVKIHFEEFNQHLGARLPRPNIKCSRSTRCCVPVYADLQSE